jgi:PIN domain nuclease of toxin-antitoxin system
MRAVLDTHAAVWYLLDSKKLSEKAYSVIDGAAASGTPTYAIPRNLVPDMPDRIIAATAVHLGVPLVSRDRRLQAAGIQTIW